MSLVGIVHLQHSAQIALKSPPVLAPFVANSGLVSDPEQYASSATYVSGG